MGLVLGMLPAVLIHRIGARPLVIGGHHPLRRSARSLWGLLWATAALVLGFAVLGARTAGAKPTGDGFALNRYLPAPAGSDWFTGDSLDLRGHKRFGLGVTADYSTNPLVLLGAPGMPDVPIVSSQFFYHLTFGLVLSDRIRLAVEWPLLLNNVGGSGVADEIAGVPNVLLSSESGGGLGDPALGVDVRIAGRYGQPFTLALGGRLFLPVGSERRFVGDGLGRVDLRVKLAGTTRRFAYAGYVGVLLRAEQDDYAAVPFGNDVLVGVSAALRFDDGRFTLGPELYGRTVFSDFGSGFLQQVTTPVEALLGARYRFPFGVNIGIAGGSGLSSGLGAADARVLASVAWAAPHRVDPVYGAVRRSVDSDGDGIVDAADACPEEPGPTLPLEPDQTGCPDGDFDGIVDALDACPAQAGPPNPVAARNGCRSLPDGDSDGVADELDACPAQVGVRQDNPSFNGCPLDGDGDGVLDVDDACPKQPAARGHAARVPGCPRAYVKDGRILADQAIQFAPSSAEILPASNLVLDELASLLLAHPEILLLAVEGHTDNQGDARANYRLSRSRAGSVAQALVARGVAAARLVPEGFGDNRPIAPNDTPQGRNTNRRVELNILRRAAPKP